MSKNRVSSEQLVGLVAAGAALIAAGASLLVLSSAPTWPLVVAGWVFIVPGILFLIVALTLGLNLLFPGLIEQGRERRRQKAYVHRRRSWTTAYESMWHNGRYVFGVRIDGPEDAETVTLICELSGRALASPCRAEESLQEVGRGTLHRSVAGAVVLSEDFQPKPPDPLPKGAYKVRWKGLETGRTLVHFRVRIDELGFPKPTIRSRIRKTWDGWRGLDGLVE